MGKTPRRTRLALLKGVHRRGQAMGDRAQFGFHGLGAGTCLVQRLALFTGGTLVTPNLLQQAVDGSLEGFPEFLIDAKPAFVGLNAKIRIQDFGVISP